MMNKNEIEYIYMAKICYSSLQICLV